MLMRSMRYLLAGGMLTSRRINNQSKRSTGLYRSGSLRTQDPGNTISLPLLSAHD
jgi:hypothetical protein